ncbi:hypothetical protein, partial [Streptomyces lienomycini]|uniref:hypothetical protein n=1 Tax=Streptomyces lienomycini TaxID=284035 RepID=UPI0031E21EA7
TRPSARNPHHKPHSVTTVSLDLKSSALDRKNPESLIAGHSLSEIEYVLRMLEPELASGNVSPSSFENATRLRNVQELARHRTFAYLCEWERRFGYSSINDSIFGGYKAVVDRLLSVHAPDLVERFNTVYRRLNEAAEQDHTRPAGEELSQALATCRRILEAVVGQVLPAQAEPSAAGYKLDQASYRSRLFEFIKIANESKNVSEATTAMAEGIHARFAAFDKLTSKGVHADVALRAANMCALNVYILCGEVLLLKQETEADAATEAG